MCLTFHSKRNIFFKPQIYSSGGPKIVSLKNDNRAFIKCSKLSKSLEFYTEILDFVIIRSPDADPSSFMSKYSLIEREGCLVHLLSHEGDGSFGNVIYVRVDNIDPLYRSFVVNGLITDAPESYPSLRIAPVKQSWGMKEFSVTDPDGNKITFGHQIQD